MSDQDDAGEDFLVLCEYFQLFVKQTVDAHEQYNTPSGRYIVYENDTQLNVSTDPNYITFCVAYVDAHDQKSFYDIGKKEAEWCENFADWLFHRGDRPELHIDNHEHIASFIEYATTFKNDMIIELKEHEDTHNHNLEVNLLTECFMGAHSNTLFQFQSQLSICKLLEENISTCIDSNEKRKLENQRVNEETQIRLHIHEVASTVLFYKTWQELVVMRASVDRTKKLFDRDQHDVVLEQLSQLCMYKFGELYALYQITGQYPSSEYIKVHGLF